MTINYILTKISVCTTRCYYLKLNLLTELGKYLHGKIEKYLYVEWKHKRLDCRKIGTL